MIGKLEGGPALTFASGVAAFLAYGLGMGVERLLSDRIGVWFPRIAGGILLLFGALFSRISPGKFWVATKEGFFHWTLISVVGLACAAG